MDEKLYEVRRREEKSISFGLIKRPQRKGLLSVPLKGLSAYPYMLAVLDNTPTFHVIPTYLFQIGKIWGKILTGAFSGNAARLERPVFSEQKSMNLNFFVGQVYKLGFEKTLDQTLN